MDDLRQDVFGQYYSSYREKVYFSGFANLRAGIPNPKKELPSRRIGYQRVYTEVRGNRIFYWSAGHCDVDRPTIERLKRSREASVVLLNRVRPEFTDADRSPERSTSVLCCSKKASKKSWECLVNSGSSTHKHQAETALLFSFLAYGSCLRFHTACQLAMCEASWLGGLFSAALIADPSGEPSDDQNQNLVTHVFILNPNSSTWQQAFVQLQVTQKKRPVCELAVFEDDLKTRPIGRFSNFSHPTASLAVDSTTNEMNAIVLSNCTVSTSGCLRSSFLRTFSVLSSVTLASSDELELTDLLRRCIKAHSASNLTLPNDGLPQSLPSDSCRLFLDPTSDVNVDLFFQGDQSIRRTFLSLLRAKTSRSNRSSSVFTPAKDPILTVSPNSTDETAVDPATVVSVRPSNSSKSSNDSTKKARMSIYFSDLEDSQPPLASLAIQERRKSFLPLSECVEPPPLQRRMSISLPPEFTAEPQPPTMEGKRHGPSEPFAGNFFPMPVSYHQSNPFMQSQQPIGVRVMPNFRYPDYESMQQQPMHQFVPVQIDPTQPAAMMQHPQYTAMAATHLLRSSLEENQKSPMLLRSHSYSMLPGGSPSGYYLPMR